MKLWMLLPLVVLVACSNSKNSGSSPVAQGESIINGKDVNSGSDIEKATVALVQVEGDSTKTFCTGTLVSKDLVLTAAHCLTPKFDGYDIQVAFGRETFNSRNESELRGIDRVYTYRMIHPRASDTSSTIDDLDDMALIKLLTSAPKSAKPVAMLGNGSALRVGQTVTLAGFGRTDQGSGQIPKYLQTTTVDISSISDRLIEVDQTHGTGACWGDSGGPAYVEVDGRLVVIGATSGAAAGYTDCAHYVVYASVPGFKEFLQKVAEVMGGEAPEYIE